MASLYACDIRHHKELAALKRTPGYCIFIDVVNSVALKGEHIAPWCAAMSNLVRTAMDFLRDLNSKTGNVECDNPLVQPTGLKPLKVIGDCIMFYIPNEAMPDQTWALNIFDGLVDITRVPKRFNRDERIQVHVAVTSCNDAYEVTFMPGTKDVQGKDIDSTARLLKEAGPQEIVMNQAFYQEARCNFLNWRAAGNVRGSEDGYMQFGNVEGPWTKSIKGFKEALDIYKWCDPRLRPQPPNPAQPTSSTQAATIQQAPVAAAYPLRQQKRT